MSRLAVATIGLLFVVSTPSFANEPGNEALVRAYLDAYNAHDVDAMLALASDDVRWYTLVDNDVETISKGKSRLRLAITALFAGLPSARSEFRAMHSIGNLVSVVEEAFWERPDGSGSQCALAVYEVADNLILNVWYFEEQPCTPLVN